MIDWLRKVFYSPFTVWIDGGIIVFLANVITVLGFALALLIIRRAFSEKRNPSNFFAWFLLVLFIPPLGVPLYFMFGGRKSRKMTLLKKNVTDQARALALGSESKLPEKPKLSRSTDGATTGNYFELLPDGVATYKRMCEEIRAAKHTIHIATYILGKDDVGNSLVDLLALRASEGIEVRLLLDSLGCWNNTRVARYKIRKAGGKVAMFMPVLPIQTHTSSNLRNHRKIAIFDNYRAITGGQNLDSRFLGKEDTPELFADFSVITEGPAVSHLTRTFISDWAFAHREPPETFRDVLSYLPEPAGDSTIEVIESGPDVENDPLWEQILILIQEFKKDLTIVTPYFVPDELILQSLLIKAHTGRRIRLVMPLRSNHRIADIARYNYLQQLRNAGVEILFYPERMLHGKLIIVDNTVAMIGSANVDMRSLFVNFEIALLHYSAADIAKLRDWAENIIKSCTSYDEATKDNPDMPSKLMQELVQLIVPLL
ncbi:MAG: phospholipase D-like domain-containing protein [Verrucomicrobiota bacterium]